MESSKQLEGVVSVRFSTLEETRAALFLELADLPPRQRSALAARITAQLRDRGLIQQSVEQHFNATQTGQLVSRSPEHIVKECKAGRFGRVYRDDGGWLVPASGIQSWLACRIFGAEGGA
jgi:hypothetical protein